MWIWIWKSELGTTWPSATGCPGPDRSGGGWATVTVRASKSKAFSQAATKLPQFTSMQNMDEHHMILIYNIIYII